MNNETKESWKPIAGFEGLYEVSSLGRVKALNYRQTGREQILKPQKNKYGYLKICLYKDRHQKFAYIHRLVSMAFLPNPKNLPQINHINENKEDNRVENLEWCTTSYNINFGSRNERVAKAKTNGKLSKKVYQYDLNDNFIKEWPSAKEIYRQTGYNNGSISNCCKGKRKTVYGYKWSYVKKS